MSNYENVCYFVCYCVIFLVFLGDFIMNLSRSTNVVGKKMKIIKVEIIAPLPNRRPISVTDSMFENNPSTNPAIVKMVPDIRIEIEDLE